LYNLLEKATGNKEAYIAKIKKYRVYLEASRAELINKVAQIVKR